MYLENVVWDAVAPHALGRFWEAVVGGERLTDQSDGFETRLAVPGGPVLDLCFQRVPEQPREPLRLHLDVRLEAGDDADEVETAILDRGVARLPAVWGDLPWRSYADPSGNEFCVLPVAADQL